MSHKIISFLSFFIFTSLAYSQFDISQMKIPLEIGYYNANIGNAKHIDMVDLIGNDYTINSRVGQNVLFGTGLLFPMPCQKLDLGVQVYYFNTSKISGSIYEESLFNNLAYDYKVINVPIYLTAQKEFSFENKPYSLMFHAGIGPNIISMYNYSEYPTTNYSISNHAFNANTSAQFSVTAGIGVKFCKQLELSYRFFYLGHSHLNPRDGVLTSLDTANMYANTLVFSWII